MTYQHDIHMLQKYYSGDNTSIGELLAKYHYDLKDRVNNKLLDSERLLKCVAKRLKAIAIHDRKEELYLIKNGTVKQALNKYIDNWQERKLFQKFIEGNDLALNEIFNRHTNSFILKSYSYTKCKEQSKDIIRKVLVNFLCTPIKERSEKFKPAKELKSVYAYFLTAIKNESSLQKKTKQYLIESDSIIIVKRSLSFFEEELNLDNKHYSKQTRLKILRKGIMLLDKVSQHVFNEWLKGRTNWDIEQQINSKAKAKDIKEKIRLHLKKYIKTRENLITFLLKIDWQTSSPLDHINQLAKDHLSKAEYKVYLEYFVCYEKDLPILIPDLRVLKLLHKTKLKIKMKFLQLRRD